MRPTARSEIRTRAQVGFDAADEEGDLVVYGLIHYSTFPVVLGRLSTALLSKTFSRLYSSTAITTATGRPCLETAAGWHGLGDRSAGAVASFALKSASDSPPMLYPFLANLAKSTRGSGFQLDAIPQICTHLRS
jgi:hypothetical protein